MLGRPTPIFVPPVVGYPPASALPGLVNKYSLLLADSAGSPEISVAYRLEGSLLVSMPMARLHSVTSVGLLRVVVDPCCSPYCSIDPSAKTKTQVGDAFELLVLVLVVGPAMTHFGILSIAW